MENKQDVQVMVEILNEDFFELDGSVMEYLDSVDDHAYIEDWCKEILPDSDEY